MADTDQGNGNGFKWIFPFNLGSFTGSGQGSIVLLIIVGLFIAIAALIGVNWVGFTRIEAAVNKAAETSNGGHIKLDQSSIDTQRTIKALLYILALPEKDRAELAKRLVEPDYFRPVP